MEQALNRFKSAVDSTYIKYQLQRHKLDRPRAKFPLFIDTNRFIIKTADSLDEFHQVLKLRHEVFFKEQLNKTLIFRIDIDEFDFVCDHLLIIEKNRNQVVGTYRLISSRVSNRFYSEQEFDLRGLLSQPGFKLELGRACIHKDFRSGGVMTLLWRGLSDYMRLTETRFLFGCSSVKTMDPLVSALIMRYLSSLGAMRTDLGIEPTEQYQFPLLEDAMKILENSVASFQSEFAQNYLPPLLKGYLRAGAKIHGLPSLDRAFKCIDLLTVLDARDSNDSYMQKFGIEKK